ncbi:MAG: SDR family oxidoreductase [Myxococcaceae bacterium]
MKVLVIGATGGTGKHLVRKLLEQGHEVTAFARNPADVATKHERLRVVKGDARDLATVEAAVAGQDAVLNAFGPRSLKRDDLQEVQMRHLVAAMKKHGVKRVVNLSAAGAGDSAHTSPFFFKIIRGTVLRHVYADKNRAEPLLLNSDLEFINVRPGQLLDTAARGGVRVSKTGKDVKLQLTREDLADFMIGQLSSAEHVRSSPVIGY